MPGITHPHQTVIVNDPASDVSSDAWNAEHLIDYNSLEPGKLAVSATDKLLGRSTAGAGAAEEIPLTAAGRTLIAGATAAAQRTTLGVDTGRAQFNVMDYGALNDGTLAGGGTNAAAAIQAAATACTAAKGVLTAPHGAIFRLEAGVTFDCDVYMPGVTFVTNNTGSIELIRINSAATTTMFRRRMVLPYCVQAGRTTGTGTWTGTDTAVRLHRAVESYIEWPGAYNFSIGLDLSGQGTDGSAYNHLYVGLLSNNKIGARFMSRDATSWVNANTLYGTRFALNSGEGLYPAGTRFVQLGSGYNRESANLFHRCSFEGKVERYVEGIASSVNDFFDGYWEAVPGSQMYVYWGESGSGYSNANKISGTGVRNIYQICSPASFPAEMIDPHLHNFQGWPLPGSPATWSQDALGALNLSSTTANAAPVLSVLQVGGGYPTQISAAVAIGATNLKLDTFRSIINGSTIILDPDVAAERETVTATGSPGTAGAGGTGIAITATTKAHATGALAMVPHNKAYVAAVSASTTDFKSSIDDPASTRLRVTHANGAMEFLKGWAEFTQLTGTPDPPAALKARLYARNYAGLTQLMARFPTGNPMPLFTQGYGYLDRVYAIGTIGGGAYAIDLSLGNILTCTVNGNETFTMPANVAGASFILIITDSGGPRNLTISVKWPNGTAVTATSGAGKTDMLRFINDGANWYGFTMGLGMA